MLQARDLQAAEERARFEEQHIQGREKRRQQAAERKQSLVQAENAAREQVNAAAEREVAAKAEKQEAAERLRAERKVSAPKQNRTWSCVSVRRAVWALHALPFAADCCCTRFPGLSGSDRRSDQEVQGSDQSHVAKLLKQSIGRIRSD